MPNYPFSFLADFKQPTFRDERNKERQFIERVSGTYVQSFELNKGKGIKDSKLRRRAFNCQVPFTCLKIQILLGLFQELGVKYQMKYGKLKPDCSSSGSTYYKLLPYISQFAWIAPNKVLMKRVSMTVNQD